MIAVRCMAWLLLLATGAALMSSPQMALAQGVSWRQALDRLAREKALAEGCASVLKIFADGAPMARVQGERLYARAKADADGLIALLLGDLADERSPANVPELRQRLEAMPRQRQALCRHVDLAIGAAAREQGARSRSINLLSQGASDAGSLVEAAVAIRNAYRGADAAQREAIDAAIMTVRWRPYALVPAP